MKKLLLFLIPSFIFAMEQTQEKHTVIPGDPTANDRIAQAKENYLVDLMHRFKTMDDAATSQFVVSTELLGALEAIPMIVEKYPNYRPNARYDLACYVLFLKAQYHTLNMTKEVSPYHAFNFNFSSYFAFSPEETTELLTKHLDELEGIQDRDPDRRKELVAAYFHGICEGFIPDNKHFIGPDFLKLKLVTKYNATLNVIPGIPNGIISRIQRFDESQHFDLLKQLGGLLLRSYPEPITFEPSGIGRHILDFMPLGFSSNHHFRIFNSKGERKNREKTTSKK